MGARDDLPTDHPPFKLVCSLHNGVPAERGGAAEESRKLALGDL
jgi:hypothetical protein